MQKFRFYFHYVKGEEPESENAIIYRKEDKKTGESFFVDIIINNNKGNIALDFYIEPERLKRNQDYYDKAGNHIKKFINYGKVGRKFYPVIDELPEYIDVIKIFSK